ncbi:MAG TPA: Nif3-like dinuclear metal center hexameric protein [Thermomicrobiales bacterium]|nr:Nif3-like dinuclear metal center hexameric protein [Thermomicrobiales bacterium]
MARRDDLIRWSDERLRASAFSDVAVNGLQVAGRREISRLAVAVSASQFTLLRAVDWGADAILVHHGLLWGSRNGPIDGPFAERLRLLLANDISLIAYHLPLDGHPEIGNCALLAHAAGYEPAGRFAVVGSEPLGVVGTRTDPQSVGQLLETMARVTEREPLAVGAVGNPSVLARVGFLTGSGYSALDEAVAAGCAALVTGDIRETTMAEARELGIVVVAAGHEATERLGVQALAGELTDNFAIEARFIADPNPI